MANEKVFGSDIIRTHNKLNNNLYELLVINPVKPLEINVLQNTSCDFVPKTEKYFIPKRNPRLKVKTVRDIRNIFEKAVCNDLSVDIDKQHSMLLRKIRGGSSKDEKTRLFAKSMLKSDKPISRMAWQMIININPDNCTHPSQYVLWNGKRIQVNGSKGGKSKFINKHDLGNRKTSLLDRDKFSKSNLLTRKDLLKHSLNVKFKPGPLSRKVYLDDSYQRYNIGHTESVHLPKPGLEILPEYGKILDTSVLNFLHNWRDESGIISEKWAEFSVSALGTNDNGCAIQLNKYQYVKFDLDYRNNQRRLLMRRDSVKRINGQIEKQLFQNMFIENEDKSKQEIQNVLDEMLVSVEINLMENNMYTGVDAPREIDIEDINTSVVNHTKDKFKRKGQSELHRLDVTVIRVCDNQVKNGNNSCRKSFCTLGCICDSLISSYCLKNHCGRIECMFECRCDFSIYNRHNSFEDNIIPEYGLISLHRENKPKLSKEEEKFHQTVILSGEKSILLKNRSRNWKAPEKYADFYSNMCLKTKKDIKQILSVVEVKLKCENIEPWCMIHNLYKCFCKGKFTEKLFNNTSNEETKLMNTEQKDTNLLSFESNKATISKTILRPRIPRDVNNMNEKKLFTDNTNVSIDNTSRCARLKPYRKRKYSDTFYFNTNKKIKDLEQNDHGLHKRMIEILEGDEHSNTKKLKNDSANPTIIDVPSSPIEDQNSHRIESLDEGRDESQNKSPINSSDQNLCDDVITTQFTSQAESHINRKLKAWLEPSLKMYKQRFSKGFFKKSLEPPKAGKISLYPWDFIVNRYHEKKNIFLVTNQKPFRIFMAVDKRCALFNNCIDISAIEDLDRYPISIKNIITKKFDRLSDQLCILRGLNICWELVGSVKKVCDRKNSDSENSPNELPLHVTSEPPRASWFTTIPTSSINNTSSSISTENNAEQSKWFIMTVEKDFSEIQFYDRGFFVKYDSIIKAINVARVSNKTVRLSSQRCGESKSDPQFGIYAIPIANERCVFIGPYEKNQPLGIETVKTNNISNPNFKTRGVWITTNKVDNLRVIDNPLLFMTRVNMENEQILDDCSQDEINKDSASSSNIKNVEKRKEKQNKVVNLVKPIKITKTNNFYHLTPSGFLKPISVSPEKPLPSSSPSILVKKQFDLKKSTTNSSVVRRSTPTSIEDKKKSPHTRSIGEIVPQDTVVKECQDSDNMQQKTPRKKFEGGMFVLKPEEINSRSLANNICFPSSVESTLSPPVDNMDIDIESFLVNSVKCAASTSDVYVISDDEDYCNTEPSNECTWKDVWIICRTVKIIGWIPGREDENGNLSFEFPGFKYTEFYPVTEAYAKITQVLARKVYIPDHVNLRWSVVRSQNRLNKLKRLTKNDLSADYVLTKRGLLHKSVVAEYMSKRKKASSNKCTMKSSNINEGHNKELEVKKTCMEEMDAKSSILLAEGEQLMNETVLKKAELTDTLSKMTNDRRQIISDRLRNFITNCSQDSNNMKTLLSTKQVEGKST